MPVHVATAFTMSPQQLKQHTYLLHHPRDPIVFNRNLKSSKLSSEKNDVNSSNNNSSNNINSTRSNDDKNYNMINSFFSNIGSAIKLSTTVQQKQKQQQLTKEEKEKELLRIQKRNILLELEMKEKERAQQVKKDAIPYILLLLLQFTPLLGNDRIISVLYFFGVAVCTVYVGGRQVTIEESEIVKKENALAAPIGASLSIGFLYVLIKMGLDPGILYAIAVSIIGALSISDIGVPLLRNLLPDSFAKTQIMVSDQVKSIFKLDDDVEELPLDGLITFFLGIVCTIGYWSPIAMEQKFILSNCELLKNILYFILNQNHFLFKFFHYIHNNNFRVFCFCFFVVFVLL